MQDELRGGSIQRGLADEDHSVEAAFLDGAYESLRLRVQIGGARRQAHRLDSRTLENRLELFGEQRGSIMDEITTSVEESVQAIGQVAGCLGYPSPGRFGHDPGNGHHPAGQPDHEPNVLANQSNGSPDLDGEEIRGRQHLPVRAQEFLPARSVHAFRGGI